MAVSTRKKNISKGLRRNVSKDNCTSGYQKTYLDKALNKLAALAKGRSVVVTVENPDPNNRKARMVKKTIKPTKRGFAPAPDVE
jgi:hypothetical protein